MDKPRLSFPQMGDYHVVIENILMAIFPNAEMVMPPLTKETIELGTRHSPDYVCAPFKYNLGNFIQALELGANVLFQTGTGCRFGYYGAVQEQILRDLGYDFRFIWVSRGNVTPGKIFEEFKAIDPTVTPGRAIRGGLLGLFELLLLDNMDFYLREHIGFEREEGAFERAKRNFLADLAGVTSAKGLISVAVKHMRAYRRIPVDMPKNPLRVGIVGELYTLMEPFSNFDLERALARHHIVVSRRMSVTFLLLTRSDRRALRLCGKYLSYTVGANGVDSVAQTRSYAKRGYDGVIHMKSAACTPEVNAEPALLRVARDYKIPLLRLSFDAQNGDTGLQTRVEAFADMLKMKRDETQHANTTQSWGGRGVDFHKGSPAG
ncbi:MAG: hypothetical protein LIO58_07175 [Oscillospiraceae bacterium]|nr:hypothetical protein [Oscillospiraceae bacterium]